MKLSTPKHHKEEKMEKIQKYPSENYTVGYYYKMQEMGNKINELVDKLNTLKH